MLRSAAIFVISLALGGCSLLPAPSGDTNARGKPTVAAPRQSVAGSQCLANLGKTGARFTALPDAYTGPSCSQLNAVQLTQLRGDSQQFAISNIGPVHCPTATAFAGWARYGVDRAATEILGAGLDRIETFGSYSCRNVAGSSRRSAHSRAEAIDVSAFVLTDGTRISVARDWNGGSAKERQFLRAVRQSACKRFGTVLSPDYNAAHEDHFHLEFGSRSFCR